MSKKTGTLASEQANRMNKKSLVETTNLKQEQSKTVERGGTAFLVTAASLVAASMWLPLVVRFPAEPMDALSFACRVNVVVGIVLMIAVRVVATIRFKSAEDNRGSAYAPPSSCLAVPAAFLQNTLEQSVLAIVANLALATIGREDASAYMTASAVLFLIGRVTFMLGYPHGAGARAFGMVMTMTPALGAFGWVMVAWLL
ncbi:MAG TPA: MAPEG family protein [Rhizomicrobium sp.]|nr:MAPEG family protein [Rhizomicrobium sp.]